MGLHQYSCLLPCLPKRLRPCGRQGPGISWALAQKGNLTHEPLPEPVTALPGEVDARDEPVQQDFGIDPLAVRDTDHYRREYVTTFAEKWDELIDWERRARATSSWKY